MVDFDRIYGQAISNCLQDCFIVHRKDTNLDKNVATENIYTKIEFLISKFASLQTEVSSPSPFVYFQLLEFEMQVH